MRVIASALIAIALSATAVKAAEPCKLAAFNQDNLRSNGYTIEPLTDQQKARFLDFEKRTQGEPPAVLEAVIENPGFALYQTGARFPNSPANKGAVMFTDADRRCVLFSHSLGADTVSHVISGTWQLRAY